MPIVDFGPRDLFLEHKRSCAIRNCAALGAQLGGDAARARHLYVLEDSVNLRKKLIGPVRFADYTGEPAGEHAVDAVLGLPEKAGAQQHHHGGINDSEAAKRFFAVHKRHGKIEQNEIEPARLFPELLQAVESG